MLYNAVIRAEVPAPPEYVTVPMYSPRGDDQALAMAGGASLWNMLWEAPQFRRRFFSEDDLPTELSEVADRGDLNVVFIPRTKWSIWDPRHRATIPACSADPPDAASLWGMTTP